MMKADIGAMHLKTKDCKGCQQSTRIWERILEQMVPCQPSEGTNPADTWISDVQPPEIGDN